MTLPDTSQPCGAKPVTCGWDVLEEFAPLYPEKLKGNTADKAPEQRVQPEEKPASQNIPQPRETKNEIDKEKG